MCHLDYATMLDLDFEFFSDCKRAWSHDSFSEIFWLIIEISARLFEYLHPQTSDKISQSSCPCSQSSSFLTYGMSWHSCLVARAIAFLRHTLQHTLLLLRAPQLYPRYHMSPATPHHPVLHPPSTRVSPRTAKKTRRTPNR